MKGWTRNATAKLTAQNTKKDFLRHYPRFYHSLID